MFHFLDSTSTKPQPPINQWFHWLFVSTGRFLPVAQASQGIDLQGRLDNIGCVGQMHLLDCHVIGIPAESTGIEIYRVMNWVLGFHDQLAVVKNRAGCYEFLMLGNEQPTETLTGFSKAFTNENGGNNLFLSPPLLKPVLKRTGQRSGQESIQARGGAMFPPAFWMIKDGVTHCDRLWMNLCLGMNPRGNPKHWFFGPDDVTVTTAQISSRGWCQVQGGWL